MRRTNEAIAVACCGLAPVVACSQAVDVVDGSGDYWQQEVHYRIEATLDESAQLLSGRARMEYVNRSPDTLNRLMFHQHLNAFRPGSEWARTEQRPAFDFASLGPDDHGFERLLDARVVQGDSSGAGSGRAGARLTPVYPHAPDSTVVEFTLDPPLAPGDGVVLQLDWEARPSTLCRRQCRQGRQWDMAQWYPRIATYDRDGWQAHPLYPQGEFYGEFASYDVTLDLPTEQVVGATGVPVEGDPGWGRTDTTAALQRDWYDAGPARSLGLHTDEGAPERKRVRFVARQVHHFAWSASPDYIHEGGEVAAYPGRERAVVVHVLYRPGDEEEWGGGRAVERTVRALTWLEDTFGPYPWPQLTNLHRLEGGGTEFPMVIMDGSASEGLIFHETAHQYAHGLFANNEWREAWLDEGFASFLGAWYQEADGSRPLARTRERLAESERVMVQRPISTPSEEFRDFATYGYMAYQRSSLVFYMLREMLGEEVFREGLRTYYQQNALQHVTEEDFRRAMEQASGQELDWFFEQWLHTTGTLDYAVTAAATEPDGDGWKTIVEVTRSGPAWMPVTLEVGEERVLLESRDARQRVEVRTATRPGFAMVDPDRVLLDVDPRNDRLAIPVGG